MRERAWLLHVRQSVFTRLVAIMLALATILLVLVFGFFLLYVGPLMNASIDGVVHEYIHTVAATAPSYAQAKRSAAAVTCRRVTKVLMVRGRRRTTCPRSQRHSVASAALSADDITT